MKKVLIIGGGESGVGAAHLCKARGWAAYLLDSGTLKDKYREELIALGVPFLEKADSIPAEFLPDLVVKSPGIPPNAKLIQAAVSTGAEIIGEIEFAYRNTTGLIVAITGTNGKTTTTSMIHKLVTDAGFDAGLCGNIGYSFARLVAKETKPMYIIEVSSFQIEDMVSFRPHIAVITNVSAHHLERYNHDINLYADTKIRLTKNQTDDDYLIYGYDSIPLRLAVERTEIKAQIMPFSYEERQGIAAWFDPNTKDLIIDIQMERKKQRQHSKGRISTEELSVKGKHNHYNTMAGGITGRLLEIRNETVRESLRSFETMEHRLEHVSTVNGVQFINDSKATNINAVWYALDSMPQNTIWIVGGIDKGIDYGPIMDIVKDRVSGIVMLGKDVEKIKNAFSGVVDSMTHALSMNEAVDQAYNMAKTNKSVVLLAPAAASFDLFENFEARGQAFKDCVNILADREHVPASGNKS